MSSTHVGPIIFGHEIAREQLESEGEVVTFRRRDRTTGDTWWRTSRTGPKEGDVHVAQIGRATSREDLEPYADLSGFDSTDAWIDAIGDVHNSAVDGYLYRVTVGHSE